MWRIKAFKYRLLEKINRSIGNNLPKRVKYYAAISVIAYATCGKYGNTEVPDLTAMEAIRRFEKDHKIS